MLKVFLSIKTSLWLTGISMAVFLAGSFYIPHNLEVFSEINDMPLFQWLSLNSADLNKFIWIYLLLGMMTLLSINMFICTLNAVLKKSSWSRLIEGLSPHVLHIGVMLVLLGHLISASTGYKQDVPLSVNTVTEVRGFIIKISDIEFFNKKGEDSTRWRLSLSINNNDKVIGPAKPAFYKGAGFFVKSVDQKEKKALIGLVYDPGAIWEVIGAIVFIIASAGIFYVKSTNAKMKDSN